MERIGLCEYCGTPLMDTDYHCVGCGARAIIKQSMISRNTRDHTYNAPSGQYFTDALGYAETPNLYADWQ